MDELFVRGGGDRTTVYPDIPIWGEIVVYDSKADAIESLSYDDKATQCVRLIRIASNRQLSNMLLKGKEVCQPHAALYMRVAETCPLHWVSWDRNPTKGGTIEIIIGIPQKGARDETLASLTASDDGRLYPVAARVTRKSGAQESGGRPAADQPLVVLPGACVVIDETFET